MRWRLRQVTSLVGDLDAAVDELRTELGLSVSLRESGQNAVQHGVTNAWLPVGTTFFEVASPVSPDSSAGRLHRRYGDGGYLIILQTDDLPAARTCLGTAGARIAWEIEEPGASELHLDHRDVGGSLLAVDWADPPGSWRWAGPDWPAHVQTPAATEILAATVQTRDPAAIAARWGELLARAPVDTDTGPEIALDRGVLRFVHSDAHGAGRLTGIDVGAASDDAVGREVALAGLDLRFVEAPDPALEWDRRETQ